MINIDALVADSIFGTLDAATDTVARVDYYEHALATYDVSQRSYTHGVCTHSNIRAVIVAPTVDEIDGEMVTHSSVKILIASNDLGVRPDAQDMLKDTANGKIYNVKKVKGAPGSSLWILYSEVTCT